MLPASFLAGFLGSNPLISCLKKLTDVPSSPERWWGAHNVRQCCCQSLSIQFTAETGAPEDKELSKEYGIAEDTSSGDLP